MEDIKYIKIIRFLVKINVLCMYMCVSVHAVFMSVHASETNCHLNDNNIKISFSLNISN